LESSFCFVSQFNSMKIIFEFCFVSNHLTGQDKLHVDVYDKDSLKDDKIGSVTIDLQDLYQQNHIENWFTIKGKLGLLAHGEIHLVLDYQKLTI